MGNGQSRTEDEVYEDYLRQMGMIDEITKEDRHKLKEVNAKTKEIKAKIKKQDILVAESRETDKAEESKFVIEVKKNKRERYASAARVVCMVMYNYLIGFEYDNDFLKKSKEILTNSLSIDVFWLLTKVPLMQLVIWPTGLGDEVYHTYDEALDDTGALNGEKYYKYLNNLLPKYIKQTVIGNIQEIMKYNIPNGTTQEEENVNEQHKSCEEYMTKAAGSINDEEFVFATLDWFASRNIYQDPYFWRMLRAKAFRGIAKKKIDFMPANYPLICPTYEFREAMMMLFNTTCSIYGQCLNKDHQEVTKVSDIASYGGRCFDINEEYAKSAQKLCLFVRDDFCRRTAIWDNITYVRVGDLELQSELERVDYKPNEEFVTINGKLHYKNPTQKYTRQLLMDTNDSGVDHHLAGINCNNTKGVLNYLIDELLHNSKYEFFNTFNNINNPNYKLMYCFDFMNTRPYPLVKTSVEDEAVIAPLQEYLYNKAIKETSQWKMTVPISNVMSSAQINYHISNNNPKYCPQYMYTRTKLINENEGLGDLEDLKGRKPYKDTFSLNGIDIRSSASGCRQVIIGQTTEETLEDKPRDVINQPMSQTTNL